MDTGTIKLCSLNCRGLADRSKRNDVFNFLAKKKYSIVCLQDVHWTENNKQSYYSEWGNDVYFCAYSSNSRGVAILFDKRFPHTIMEVHHDTDGNYLMLIFRWKEYVFNLVTIYGPNSDSPNFYEALFKESIDIVCDFNIFCGDWNLVQDFEMDCNLYENLNNPRAQNTVLKMKNESNLVDPWRTLYPNTRQYTWRRRNPIKQARLDWLNMTKFKH